MHRLTLFVARDTASIAELPIDARGSSATVLVEAAEPDAPHSCWDRALPNASPRMAPQKPSATISALVDHNFRVPESPFLPASSFLRRVVRVRHRKSAHAGTPSLRRSPVSM